MPIEEMADRGKDTLSLRSDARGWAHRSAQRQTAACRSAAASGESRARTLYNLVGFQTKMTYPEQRRVFALIPGLAKAEFVRLGSMHRNTFINAPLHLGRPCNGAAVPRLFFAGQMTGVEGYIESAATGMLAGINAARLLAGDDPVVPPITTALGSLLAYITDSERKQFQPMNVNFGLIPPLAKRLRGKAKKEMMSRRALADLTAWAGETGLIPSSTETVAVS